MPVAEFITLGLEGIKALENFTQNYQTVRATLGTEDQMKLDATYQEVMDRSNAVADRLRATPDDKV